MHLRVLHLRSKTVAVHRQMNMVLDDDQMIPGDECGLNFLTFVLQFRKITGKTNQETDPTGEPGPAGREATTSP